MGNQRGTGEEGGGKPIQRKEEKEQEKCKHKEESRKLERGKTERKNEEVSERETE